MNHEIDQHHRTFEDIRQYTKEVRENLTARDLLFVLEYNSWDKFKSVIRKAMKACNNSGIPSADHRLWC